MDEDIAEQMQQGGAVRGRDGCKALSCASEVEMNSSQESAGK